MTFRLSSLWVIAFGVTLAFAALPPGESCEADTVTCGGIYKVCCRPGLQCRQGRGIPMCAEEEAISGYMHARCDDPDLFRCNVLDPITTCCPMGTMCLTNGRDGVVKCVDVMGVTVPAYPSATSVMIDTPPASAVPGTEPVISYSPTEAWNTTEANLSCRTKASTLHVTDVINATVSFNYSGPSVIVHTVKSSRGGLFAVFIDGFNTTSTIDTYRPPLDDPTEDPECFTVQFPPMRVLPPGFDSRTEHTISLVYQGPSSKPDDGPVDGSFVQFDSFSVPIFSASELDSSAAFGNMPSAFAILCSLSTVVASFML